MATIRLLLVGVAVLGAAVAAGKAWRRGHAVLGAIGGGLTISLVASAAWLVDSPAAACLLLHAAVPVGVKTFALRRAPAGTVGVVRGIAFLLVHPGLDASRALVSDPSVSRRRSAVTVIAAALEVMGAFALVAGADHVGLLAAGTWPAAWVRAVALLWILDGVSRLGAGLCGLAGARGEEVFRSPWRAADLSEFWGVRWNRFLGRSLYRSAFRPAARRVGPRAAALVAFAASGALHEILFVIPSGGPAGFYMAFFGVQWAGVLATSRIRSGGLRCAASWALLAASVPLFFAGPFRAAAPIERALAWPA